MKCFTLFLLLLGITFKITVAEVAVSSSKDLEVCLKKNAIDFSKFSEQEWLFFCMKYYLNKGVAETQSTEPKISLWADVRGRDYINSLIDRFSAEARNATSKRIRKEYRMLTDEERRNYHTAIRMLRDDTATGFVDGSSFLPWIDLSSEAERSLSVDDHKVQALDCNMLVMASLMDLVGFRGGVILGTNFLFSPVLTYAP
ncbi:Hypothetical predicted protein [Octopus vulgaris]|uniref:Uncharacterized protein n=1 Tax=Octopus vulgaris TaxID=6645 RepID=A0AA36AP12_OCTVU|nr:Hypothetical predicted protein [Octopus vulgaris]